MNIALETQARSIGAWPLPSMEAADGALYAARAKDALDTARRVLIMLASADVGAKAFWLRLAKSWITTGRIYWRETLLSIARGTSHLRPRAVARVHVDGEDKPPQWSPVAVIYSDYRMCPHGKIAPTAWRWLVIREDKRYAHRRSAERAAKTIIERIEHGLE